MGKEIKIFPVIYRESHLLSWTWVGLTLIWVFPHLAKLGSRFCQIAISPDNHSKFKSTQPRPQAYGTPCSYLDLLSRTLKSDLIQLCLRRGQLEDGAPVRDEVLLPDRGQVIQDRIDHLE